MNKLIAFSFIILCLFSCDKDNESQPKVFENVKIRIENASNFRYENILVKAFGNDYNYGDLNLGEMSPYQIFDSAYSYAYTELEINGQQYIIQPIDFIGESLLENGEYTYIISADTTGGIYSELELVLRED